MDRADDPTAATNCSEYVSALRTLRASAGQPSLRRLARQTGFPHSTIADAFDTGRRRLPSLEIVSALVAQLCPQPGARSSWLVAWRRLQAADASMSTPRPSPAAPHEIPGDLPGFHGQVDHLAELDHVLDRAGVATAVISGMGGIGKTTLAVHWAHRVRARFPDGQLHIDLRGYDPDEQIISTAHAQQAFLAAFGVGGEGLPTEPDALDRLYRSVLADRHVLIVLDNASSSEQVHHLLPVMAGSVAIVTSRNAMLSLVALTGASIIQLDVMSVTEARAVLAERIGTDRVEAEPGAVARIIERCGRLPLALAVTAAHAAAHPEFPLTQLADDLERTDESLDRLSAGEPRSDVRAVLSWSYRALAVAPARMFRMLALQPGPDIGTYAAAALAGVDEPTARALLRDLTDAHLVAEVAPGRFVLHDLLRLYATELLTRDETADRIAGQQRLLTFYTQTATEARRLSDVTYHPVDVPPASQLAIEHLVDQASALAWLATESDAICRVLLACNEERFDAAVVRLSKALISFLSTQGRWHNQASIQHRAITAGRRLGDKRAEADAKRTLASTAIQLGDHADAVANLNAAMYLYREIDDPPGESDTYLDLAWAADRHDRASEALEYAKRALSIQQRLPAVQFCGYAPNAVGWYYAQLGHLDDAFEYCTMAMRIHVEHGDLRGQAETSDSLGFIWQRRGDVVEALKCYQEALDGHRERTDRDGEADTLDHIGDALDLAGDTDTAIKCWQDAYTILSQLGHVGAASIQTKIDQAQAR